MPIITASDLYLSQARYERQSNGAVLFDKKDQRIVNNRSSEVDIRIFNEAFDELGALPGQLLSHCFAWWELTRLMSASITHLMASISAVLPPHKQLMRKLYTAFETLDFLEEELEDVDYLIGNQLTEADIRPLQQFALTLCTTDTLSAIKSVSKIIEPAPLCGALYEQSKIAATVDFEHIKHHYYGNTLKLIEWCGVRWLEYYVLVPKPRLMLP